MKYDDDVVECVFSNHGKLNIQGLTLYTKETCKSFKYDDSWICYQGKFYNNNSILCDRRNSVYLLLQSLRTNRIFENVYKYELEKRLTVKIIHGSIVHSISMTVHLNGTPNKKLQNCNANKLGNVY